MLKGAAESGEIIAVPSAAERKLRVLSRQLVAEMVEPRLAEGKDGGEYFPGCGKQNVGMVQ
jgi:hypothetical protein